MKLTRSRLREIIQEEIKSLNEKTSRMEEQPWKADGIIGEVMLAFVKKIEGIRFDGDAKYTSNLLDKEWDKFSNTAHKIILAEVKKSVKSMDDVLFVSVNITSMGWTPDTINGLNRPYGRHKPASDTLSISSGQLVINVGFIDNVDANKYAKRLGGIIAPPYTYDIVDIYGTFDESAGNNNIKIQDGEMLRIDNR